MAVFKKKAKAKDDTYLIPPAASSDPALPTKMSRSLKRKQKNVVEPKPEIDLTTVLPDKNDFRTSLLLPGLTARFSMLREQDDPNTKVGKASDDSVLFPKRASRLNLFSHNPLTDIAETESIQTAFRAPFSEEDRSYSFSEGAGYASDDAGTVLARARPIDGNNLFGGRQKMYRIPTASGSGSSKDLTEAQAPLTSGRHVYQNDVVLSPYQQMRLKAREEQDRDESHERPASAGAEEADRSSVINTPSTGFSKSRGTTSSTASGPSNRRISTAATSVVSDTPHPRQSNTSASSNNRMHSSEYGSEENLLKRNFSSDSRKGLPGADNQAQPPLPMSPSNSRQLFQSSSVSNLADKYAHGASPFSSNAFRAGSPPPALQTQALASLDFGLKNSHSHPRKYQTTSPTNDEDDGPIYKQSLQPNDRGKATAMGLFNRPQQQFDEQKFQERQLQMHGGRVSPPTSDGPDYGGIADRQNEPGRVVLPSIPTSPFKGFRGRESGSTSVTTRSRAQSAASVNPAQVQAQVEALIKRQNEEYSTLQTQKSTTAEAIVPPAPLQPPKSLREQPAASRGTFFDTFDGSDDDDADSPMLGRYEPAPRLAPLDVHPALRDGSQAFDFGDHVSAIVKSARPQSNVSADTSSPSVAHDTPDTSDSLHLSSHTKARDSPTLGPTTGLGLSGLIRAHLRHDSDRSSVMPPPSPGQPPYQSSFSFSGIRDREPSIASIPAGNYRGSVREREPSVSSTQPGNYPASLRDREPSIASTARTTNPPESTHSDPWEFDNAHRTVRNPLEPVQNEALPAMSQKAQQILGQALSHRNQASSKTQQVLGDDAPRSGDGQHPANRPWPYDALSHHHRGESTETQKEFGNELAERARRIQEGLKGVAEAEKRSRSQDRHNPAAQALQALRHKSSKTSLAPRANEPQPKAMKMLGIGVGPKPEPMGRSPNMGARGEYEFDQGYDDYESRPTPRQRPAEFEPPSGRRTPGFSRPGPAPGPGPYPSTSNEDPERHYQRPMTPNSGRARRNRAESEAAERSRSRGGRYRDELPYHPAEYGRPGPPHLPSHREEQQRRPYGHPDGPHGYPGPHAPRGPPPRGPPPVDQRTYERSASAMSNRQPSGTRPGPAGYFDGRAATPTMGGTPQLGPGPMPMGAPRPSPRPPFPHSPISPFASQPGMSPALSGPGSDVLSALPSPSGPLPQQPPTGRFTPVEGRSTPAGSRKKSVTKGMISEPTFISSTSSVPLVGLPNGPRPSQIASPPIPSMNPRRRGNTTTERPDGYPSPRMHASQMPSMPESPGRGGGLPMSAAQRAYLDQQQQMQQRPPPRPRNRLRKISSEGGSMAARARNQAMISEFGHEKLRSPAIPVFPNRSATSLSMHQDGGMF